MSGIADSWWRIGPALADRGWDVTAVDQAGHGGRPVHGDATNDALAQAILDVYPDGPDVLIGHSLGAITALALLEREPGWARTVILEEPASSFAPAVLLGIAASLRADVAAVRQDRQAVEERVRRHCPRWAAEDVHWAVQGIAELDAEPFARHLIALARDTDPRPGTPERILAAAPEAHILVADTDRSLLEGGSALDRRDREALVAGLPEGRVVALGGGHCLHRDVPDEWLAAVAAIIS
jgi:pimeloyl-ACP methyl ester carboxylesterase